MPQYIFYAIFFAIHGFSYEEEKNNGETAITKKWSIRNCLISLLTKKPQPILHNTGSAGVLDVALDC